MKRESDGYKALEQFIADIGAPRHLHSDNAMMETSDKWKDILRKYVISSSTTEPHQPQQNLLKGEFRKSRRELPGFLTAQVLPVSFGSMLCSYGSKS